METMLFHDTLFEVFGEVGADLGGSTFGSDLCHIGINHQLYELLKRGLVRVPAELGTGLGGITPEVHHIGGTVEVGGDLYEDVAYGEG